MSEQQYRIAGKVKRHTYTADVAACDDTRLGYRALGIHTYIMRKLSWNPRWVADERDIINRHSDGQFAVRSAIKELIEYGYANRVQLRKDGVIVGWQLLFYARPEDNEYFQPGSEHERSTSYVVIEIDDSQDQGDRQDADYLDVENPNLGFRDQYINKLSSTSNPNDLDLTDQERGVTLDAFRPVQATPTQQPPQPQTPTPPARQPEPPMGERSGFHDLLGQSRNSWFGMRATQRDALQRQQLARQAGLGDGLSGEVVDKLIELHGLRAVVDAGDDRSLRRMQDMAILLGSAPLFVRTVEQIVALFDDWKAANRNKIAPYGNVFAEYASRLHAEGRLQDGQVIGKPAAGGGSSSGKGRGRVGGARRQPASDGIDWNAASRATGEYILANVPDVPIGDIDF